MVTVPAGRASSPAQIQMTSESVPNMEFSSRFPQTTPSSNDFGLSSASSSSVNGETSSNQNKNTLRMDFWRLPENVGRFRRPVKRSNVPPKNSDDDSSCPKRKVRITEEKMLARLRNFHIGSAPNNVDSNWFFMEKPMERFDDIESRMSDDEEVCSEPDDNLDRDEPDNGEKREGKALLLSSVLKRILDQDCKRVAAATTSMPAPCTDIVLWKPREDFIRDILPPLPMTKDGLVISTSESGDQSCGQDSDIVIADVQYNDAGNGSFLMNGINTMDDEYTTMNGFVDSVLQQRRNARQFSKPIIEVLNVSSNYNTTGNGDRGAENSSTSDDQGMMDIDS